MKVLVIVEAFGLHVRGDIGGVYYVAGRRKYPIFYQNSVGFLKSKVGTHNW
jgi:hypothetical protein